MNVDFNNLILSEEQVETIAFNIYKDIEEYLQQHQTEYLDWLVKNIVIELNNYIMTLSGFVKHECRYKYKICSYIF